MVNEKYQHIESGYVISEWDVECIDNIAKTSSGGTPSRSNKLFYNGKIKWVTTGELKDCQIFDTHEHISELGLRSSSAKLFDKNTILIAMYGATIGKLGILKTEASTNQACCAIMCDPVKCDFKYLFYYLQSIREYIVSLGSGAGQPNISQNIVKKLQIPLPTLEEQRCIASALSDVDELIESLGKLIKKYKAIKMACLQTMFVHQGESIPLQRFPDFSGDWKQRTLGEWGEFYYGRSCPKWSVTDNATIPCIRYGELYTKFGTKIDKIYSYTNMSSDSLRFSKGTEVLIPRVGEDPMDYNHCTWLSLSNVAIGEMISVFNTDQDPLFSATMFNAVLKNEFAKRVEGGSVTNLYYDKLKDIAVSYPDLREQKTIAEYFEQLDNLIVLHQRKLEKTKKIKQGMMQKLFSGEIRLV